MKTKIIISLLIAFFATESFAHWPEQAIEDSLTSYSFNIMIEAEENTMAHAWKDGEVLSSSADDSYGNIYFSFEYDKARIVLDSLVITKFVDDEKPPLKKKYPYLTIQGPIFVLEVSFSK